MAINRCVEPTSHWLGTVASLVPFCPSGAEQAMLGAAVSSAMAVVVATTAAHKNVAASGGRLSAWAIGSNVGVSAVYLSCTLICLVSLLRERRCVACRSCCCSSRRPEQGDRLACEWRLRHSILLSTLLWAAFTAISCNLYLPLASFTVDAANDKRGNGSESAAHSDGGSAADQQGSVASFDSHPDRDLDFSIMLIVQLLRIFFGLEVTSENAAVCFLTVFVAGCYLKQRDKLRFELTRRLIYAFFAFLFVIALGVYVVGLVFGRAFLVENCFGDNTRIDNCSLSSLGANIIFLLQVMPLNAAAFDAFDFDNAAVAPPPQFLEANKKNLSSEYLFLFVLLCGCMSR